MGRRLPARSQADPDGAARSKRFPPASAEGSAARPGRLSGRTHREGLIAGSQALGARRSFVKIPFTVDDLGSPTLPAPLIFPPP